MLAVIRGAGDLATGIALRLRRTRVQVAMTDLPRPTAIRRTVCFSQALLYGSMAVEEIRAVRAEGPEEEETGNEEEILDEDVPPVNIPKTGDGSGLWYAMAMLSACGLAVLNLLKKREQ